MKHEEGKGLVQHESLEILFAIVVEHWSDVVKRDVLTSLGYLLFELDQESVILIVTVAELVQDKYIHQLFSQIWSHLIICRRTKLFFQEFVKEFIHGCLVNGIDSSIFVKLFLIFFELFDIVFFLLSEDSS